MQPLTRDLARPADPPATTPALGYPELQGQRGLAALTIVVFHVYQYHRTGPDSYPLQDSWLHPLLFGLDGMVDWFFVLSAFLLTMPYARALIAGRSLTSAGQFLGRRAVRIVPLYLIAITVVWVSRNPSLPGDWRDLVEHLTFTQVYDDQRIFFTIGPAWSLAVEVQFYVVLAVVGVVLARTAARASTPGRRLAPLVVAIALLAAASAAWVAVTGLVLDRPFTQFSLWFSLPPKLVVFAVGMAVAVLVARRPDTLRRSTTLCLRAGGSTVVLVAMVALVDRETGPADWLFHLLCALGFGAIVLAGARGPARGPWHRFSSVGVLPMLGLVSYSLYLWHEPLLLHLAGNGLLPEQGASGFVPTLLVVGPLSLLAAYASYWVIEYPFSNLRVFLSDLPSRELQAERRTAL